jgi:hypothetical protein
VIGTGSDDACEAPPATMYDSGSPQVLARPATDPGGIELLPIFADIVPLPDNLGAGPFSV